MERIRETTIEDQPSITAFKASKYINQDKEKKAFYRIAVFFLFCYFVLPQYFGLNIPVFDLTAQRIGIIALLFFILEKRQRVYDLVMLIKNCKVTPWFGLFLLVLLYTAIFKTHAGTFLYSFIEILGMYLFMYVIKHVIGIKKTIKILLFFMYILCFLGLIEYVLGKSPFSYLETIPGLYTGAMVRSGSYRIMGPANHSLAYGLILIASIPFVCLDLEEDKIDVLKNIPLLLLMIVNIFLTGSRSTLAVFLLEMLLLILFSAKKEKKKAILFILFFGAAFLIFVFAFQSTSLGRTVLIQITSIIDEILGTTISASFGADLRTLSNSSVYRSILPKIFTLDAFNPLLGKGSGYHFAWYYEGYFIQSIDNYYVATYIRYAYPGLIINCILLIVVIGGMLINGIKRKSGFFMVLFIGSVCYFINLWWLDTLQTIKYVYILFAFYYVYLETVSKNGVTKNKDEKKKSYIRMSME